MGRQASFPDEILPPQAPLGRALRRWRALHRVKQSDAADRFGVAQSTISRWESGQQAMEPAERIKVEAVLGARLDAGADRVLAALVTESPRPVHLICDLSHRLLALSAERARGFGCKSDTLMGRSLWPFITEELAAMEARLPDLGWRERPAIAPVELETGANGSDVVPVRPSRCRWTRFILSDGTAARFVETLSDA
jgi:transcriptional regulator with XRE-family HTH domain